MANLTVSPQDLKDLAKKQDHVAEKLEKGAQASDNLGTHTWVTHGPICGWTNAAVVKAEPARRAAGMAINKVSSDLADALRDAADRYHRADERGAEEISKQVLPD